MGELSIWHWIVLFVVLIVFYLPAVLYIRSFQRTATVVNAATPARPAPVKSAWLLLVPLLGLVWFFVLLLGLREAVRDKGIGRSLWWTYGLIAGILYTLTCFVSSVSPTVGLLGFVGLLVFTILHWVELVALRSEFQKIHAPLPVG